MSVGKQVKKYITKHFSLYSISTFQVMLLTCLLIWLPWSWLHPLTKRPFLLLVVSVRFKNAIKMATAMIELPQAEISSSLSVLEQLILASGRKLAPLWDMHATTLLPFRSRTPWLTRSAIEIGSSDSSVKALFYLHLLIDENTESSSNHFVVKFYSFTFWVGKS